ncbi:hypothetical protein [Serratia nevei]|uniref:hypothetical protein n=1 Tax=Serratia nevei TaxID=2703794 RepID=UPI003F815E30
MENSFVKGYEKSELQDGSTVYKVKSARLNKIPLITVFGTATVAVSWGFLAYSLRNVDISTWIPFLIAVAIAYLVIRVIVYKKEELTIVFKKGLKLSNNKTIPFKDLNNIYVANIDEQGTVQAETNGKRITVISLVSLPLARLILADILSHYEAWKESN